MGNPAESTDFEAVNQAVRLLNAQADGLRAEIGRLRQELANVQRDLKSSQPSDLIEANGQLMLSAIHAGEAAETAAGELEELTHSSQRDVLTGTPNRALMHDRIETAIAFARRRGTRAAVLFLDVDRFKDINDSQGHAAGDEVIRLVARRLQDTVRGSDTVSRHGGDEFVVLLTEVAGPTDPIHAAEKILAAISQPSMVGGQDLHLSISVGIAVFPEDGCAAVTLIDRADAAMYRAKRRGRGCLALYGDDKLV